MVRFHIYPFISGHICAHICRQNGGTAWGLMQTRFYSSKSWKTYLPSSVTNTKGGHICASEELRVFPRVGYVPPLRLGLGRVLDLVELVCELYDVVLPGRRCISHVVM